MLVRPVGAYSADDAIELHRGMVPTMRLSRTGAYGADDAIESYRDLFNSFPRRSVGMHTWLQFNLKCLVAGQDLRHRYGTGHRK